MQTECQIVEKLWNISTFVEIEYYYCKSSAWDGIWSEKDFFISKERKWNISIKNHGQNIQCEKEISLKESSHFILFLGGVL